MPDPQTPSTVFGDQNMMGGATNEAMPQFGGIANPGESIHISVDGEERMIQPDENGLWDYQTPELNNGEHEFEMWSENMEGDRSDAVEWESDVGASENDRASQRHRNEQWEGAGRHEWRDQNSGLTPTPVVPGGGGGQTTTGGGEPGGGTRPRTGGVGGSTPAVSGLEKGNQPGPTVMG